MKLNHPVKSGAIVLLFIFFAQPLTADPDTLINRYATSTDATFWPTVNEGDYLIFSANNLGNTATYFRDNNPSFPTIATALGKKIHI